jgi:hypothetical protein
MFVKKLKKVTQEIDDAVAADRVSVFLLHLKVDMRARYNSITVKD